MKTKLTRTSLRALRAALAIPARVYGPGWTWADIEFDLPVAWTCHLYGEDIDHVQFVGRAEKVGETPRHFKVIYEGSKGPADERPRGKEVIYADGTGMLGISEFVCTDKKGRLRFRRTN